MGKLGTASQFQRRELVTVPVLRRAPRPVLPPGDGVRGRVLALSRIGDAAGELGTRVGDGRTQRLLAVFGLGLAAIALPAEYHADLNAYAVALKRRSEEHTSELQSLRHLVCRLLL